MAGLSYHLNMIEYSGNVFSQILLLAFDIISVTLCKSSERSLVVKTNDSLISIHYVDIYNAVLLPCPYVPGVSETWMHNSDVLNFRTFIVDEHLQGNVFVFKNYSLYISSVSFVQEGLYRCIRGGASVIAHSLKIYGLYFVTFSK